MTPIGAILADIMKRLALALRTRPDPSAYGAKGLDL
jgi:hypothetical protein